jgi:hypothetical protein
MSLIVKKKNIVQLILSIESESIIDEIRSRIIPLLPQKVKEPNPIDLYRTHIENKLDLEKIKQEQGFNGIDKGKMNRLIEEAQIEESIEELLEMI